MCKNKAWDALKARIDQAGKQSFWLAFVVTFVLPVVEAVLVNIWTGLPEEFRYVPRLSLLAVVTPHFILGALVLAGQRVSSDQALAAAADAEETLCRTQAELSRRTEAYRTVVTAIETFNSQTCNLTPHCLLSGYEEGLLPVVHKFLQNINVTLGVSSAQYTF